MFRYPVVDEGADADANQDVRKDLRKGGDHLFLRVDKPLAPRERGRFDVHAARLHDELLHVLLHAQLLDESAADHGQHEADDDVDDRDFGTEDAHQQHQAAEINHRRGDQEREGDAQRQPRTREADKERDRRAGAERRHGAEQRRDAVGPEAVEAAQDLFAALGREVALDVRNDEDQQAEQPGDLEHVVEKELQTSAEPRARVEPDRRQNRADQPVEPVHAEDLVLNEIPNSHLLTNLSFYELDAAVFRLHLVGRRDLRKQGRRVFAAFPAEPVVLPFADLTALHHA